jgi:glyoxylase-like metal-dependent hydrolase (beta-lactamase superfamily II)
MPQASFPYPRDMREITPGIHRLGSSHHNFYVIAEGGKATVIDAGCSKEWPKLVEGLTTIGLAPNDVEAIIVTHAHADHIGFGRQAQEEGLRVEVHTEEETRALGTYKGKTAISAMQMPLWKPATWGFLIALIKVGVMKQPSLDSVETFDDGDVLDLPGHPRVVHTPGHTEGHSAFLLEDRKVLFAGDAIVTQDLFGSDVTRPQVMKDVFHNDPAQVTKSLDRLTGLTADLVLPGHGEPFPGSPAEMVRQAVGG